ncbi:hypothetical protein [Halococcus salsus]|uniref:hypothetical protein n=1 Tax=Halococcus salsus TaxID=2162894 RepID=UPI00135ADFD8|nr:hypothetical protein [Halococcus salsus]
MSDAQNQNNNESGRGAIYGEASDERAARMHEAYDAVYPEAEREVEVDTTIDGVSGSQLAQRGAEQARLDRGTDEAVDGSWGGPGGDSEYGDKTLYTQERIEGREAELEKISERAGANPDVQPRPEEAEQRRDRQMDLHQQRMTECKAEVEAEAASGTTSRGFVDDPRGHVEQDVLAEVNTQAARLAEQFGVTRAVAGKRLAEKVVQGEEVKDAVLNLNEELVEERTVVTPLSMVDPTNSWVTVEGVVARLFNPASSNQQQVAVIEDSSGDGKVTIWRNSNQDVRLNEGDVVRIVDGKPGSYNGQPTVAATSDTDVWTVEKGDGRSIGNFGHGANGGQTQDRPSSSPSISSKPVPRPAADRLSGRERWFFPHGDRMPQTEDVDVELSFEGAEDADSIERKENPTSGETAGYVANTDERFDTAGVSWAEEKRREAETKGQQKRLAEKKYNIPAWRRTVSRITSYEHQDMTAFGADQRMIELDLPALRNHD